MYINILLGALTIGRGSARPGWWWRESKKSNKPSKLPKINKNDTKCRFPTLIDFKNAKNAFFT